MHQLVLLRHGESEFNRSNRFTGWIDCDLTERGVDEAKGVAHLMDSAGFRFDVIYTSVLRGCTRTVDIVKREMRMEHIPVIATWRFNERHCGALQGLNKAETAAKFAEDQVRAWRRSYAESPPSLDPNDPDNPSKDPKYERVPKQDLPLAESLKDTVERVVPYWASEIAPRGKRR